MNAERIGNKRMNDSIQATDDEKRAVERWENEGGKWVFLDEVWERRAGGPT